MIAAAGVTLVLGAPALLDASWQSSLAPVVFFTNLPGILLAIPHVPPEGVPRESPFQAALMLLVQVLVWFSILTGIMMIVRRRTHASTPKV